MNNITKKTEKRNNSMKSIFNFKKMTGFAFIMLFVFGMSLESCRKTTDSHSHSTPVFNSSNYITLKSNLRVLWSDHALWTRNVIVNFVDDLPGKNEAVARLLKNQEDIGNAIKPYYGDAGGNALTALLKEHIIIAADILTAAKNGNTNDFNTAVSKWYQNGDDIANFLTTANPDNWPLSHTKPMMKSHLDLTLEEASSRLNHDYNADVAAYDKVYNELMEMSDMIADGIAKQFPDKF